jgi:hypothetical protein
MTNELISVLEFTAILSIFCVIYAPVLAHILLNR